jgi:hypothetical protein
MAVFLLALLAWLAFSLLGCLAATASALRSGVNWRRTTDYLWVVLFALFAALAVKIMVSVLTVQLHLLRDLGPS